MQDDIKELLKKLAGFSIGPFLAAIISFITVPITTYIISPIDFGKSAMYTMTYSISSLCILLGFDQAFVREYNASENKKELYFNSLFIPFVFSIILGAIYNIFYKSISMLMFDNIDRYTVVVLSISLPFAVIDRFNMLILRMEERTNAYSFLTVLNKFLILIILIPYIIFIDRSYVGIINSMFISLVIVCIVENFYISNIWKNKTKINKRLLKKMFKFGFPLIPTSIIGWFFNSMDKIALRQWSDFTQIGIYSVAFKIVGLLTIVQTSFTAFWIPTAYKWYEMNENNNKYVEISEILLTIMCLIFSFIILFKDLIVKFVANNYLIASKSVPFLLFFPIMYTISETTTLGIPFSRKTSYNIIISVVSTCVNFIGNYFLVPQYGSLGASISTGVSYIVFFWMRTLISRRLWFKFSIKIYINNTILMVLLAIGSVTINSIVVNIFIVICIIYVNKKTIYKVAKIIKIII